jgi:phenylacetate-coenzyme A ligase PaaK-like adenylate-forming protein
LRKLDEFKPNFITAYVHVLEQLAYAAKEGRTNIHKNGQLQLVVAISEPLPSETQRFITEHLGVPVANHYAMGECPSLSLGCPQGRGAHVNVDMAVLENVDDNYNPVPDGQPGSKVVVTNLLNKVQPFIRYEIDDVITISHEPCPCGNPLPLVTSIAGRANDQFWIVTPSGEVQKMSNFIFKDAFLELYDIAEYQVLQTGTNRFLVLAQPVPGGNVTVERVREVVEELARAEDMPAQLELEVQFIDQIPRDAKSGKVRRFINKVGKPDEVHEVVAVSR